MFLCASLLFAVPRVALADRPSPEELTSKIDQYMAARVERDHFNGTVLLAKDGRPLFCRGYGMANLEHDVPCTANTKFRLGSITKQFTAMAILILQERGKLAVTDKVKKYISDAPKAWDDITIHHLLTHTSGIPNYTGFPDFLKTLRNQVTLDELIAKFKDKPLDFKPGEKFKYSNSGYIVLGKIIETASGRPYADVHEGGDLRPTRDARHRLRQLRHVLKNRASGYSRTARPRRRLMQRISTCQFPMPPGPSIRPSSTCSSGIVPSTPRNWSPGSRSRRCSRRSKISYGYGWTIDKKFDQPRHVPRRRHPGFRHRTSSGSRRKSCSSSCSATSRRSRVGTIGSDLAAIALGGPYVIPREPKPVQVDAHCLATYAGQYQLDSAATARRSC